MKCGDSNCEAEATHMPKICVPATGWPIDQHNPISVVMGLKLCLKHTRAFRAKETLGLKGEHTMRKVIEVMAKSYGGVPPDFARAFVQPISIDSPEGRALEISQKSRAQ
jgi:hypothetical protein